MVDFGRVVPTSFIIKVFIVQNYHDKSKYRLTFIVITFALYSISLKSLGLNVGIQKSLAVWYCRIFIGRGPPKVDYKLFTVSYIMLVCLLDFS
jgi:hypothetical protein